MKTANSIFKIFLVALLLAVQVHFAYAQTAALLPVAPQQFFDKNGNPVTSGSVGYYIPGTSTPKMVWQDDSQTTPWSNPITLNAGGWPPNNKGIYGSGTYRQIIKDKNNNIISDQPTSATGSGGGSGTSVGDGNSVGTILTWSGMIAPNQYQFAYGQALSRSTYPELYQAVTLNTNITCVGGNTTLTGISDTNNIPIGANVEGNCIVAGSTVISKTINTVTLSIAANISTTTSARFFPYGNGNGTTTFNAPDLRGKVIPGRTNMGGVTASNLTNTYYGSNPDAVGANGGTQSKTIVTANLPPYTPTGVININDPGHNHSVASSANSTLQPGGANIAVPSGTTVTGNRVTGLNSSNVLFDGTPQGGTSTAFAIIPPSITMNYIIKVTPDTSVSGLFGVASIGGMQGIIACGTGLTCAGNIISAVAAPPAAGGAPNEIQYNAAGALGGITNSTAGYAMISNGPSSVPSIQGFTQAGVSAVVRTWQNKNRDIINAKDFGVTCDGVTTDTTAIQAAETYRASVGGELVFPQGTCKTAGITINRANGGGWKGTGQTRFIPTANSITFMTVTGAVISSTAPRPFYVENIHFDGNTNTGITAYSENSPYLTSLKHLKITNVQYGALIIGSSGSSQTGWVNIDDIEQIGSGSWAFLSADDTHYLFAINVSNFNQNGTGASTWSGATQAFLLRRAVSVMFDNVLLKSLDGAAAGYYMLGDCQGIFINNSVVAWPTYGVRAEAWTDGLIPAYVYINNFGVDQHTVSGADIAGRTWRVNNSNFANGYIRTNTGQAFRLRSTATDISISNTLFAYDQRSGLVVDAGAAKVRVDSITAENNNQVAGSFYDIDIGASTSTNVVFYGKNIYTSLNAVAQTITTDGRTITSSMREKLTANRTYYVRTDGNDNCNGLVNSAGSSGNCGFLTIQKAVDVAASLDLGIFNVQVNIATGAYNAQVILKSFVGAGTIILTGDTTTPSNVTITVASQDAITATGVTGLYKIEGIKFAATTSGSCIFATASQIQLGVNDYGACATSHLRSEANALLSLLTNYTISGASTRHMFIAKAGVIIATTATVTITGTPAFSTAFVVASGVASLTYPNMTFSGSATGPRFLVTYNAAVDTSATLCANLPGNSAGSTSSGGQCP